VALARVAGWHDVYAPVALQVVNSLWHGDLRGFARSSLRLRELLDDLGLDSAGAVVMAGLLTMKAEQVLARVHEVDARHFRRLVARQAGRARHQGWLLSVYLGEQAHP
jgi:hypothetical protein